ncbi:MAG: HEAT repeat domain-containing protein [Planctomycetota bacterium]|jgi:HEAT repeat protein|nr:HEAT repeat domain-containing protein [Planctomycetota bacterium]
MRKEPLLAMLLGVFTLLSCANPIEDIRSENSITRTKAAAQFTEDASSDQIQKLIHIMQATEDNGVRASCADALGYAHATSAVPALIDALKVAEWRVRRSTANALGRIADPRAIDPLIEVLDQEITDPNLSEGKRCAVWAFVNLKSEKVVPVLIHMLSNNPGKDNSEKIDYTTALLAAMGAQKDKRAIPAIADHLDSRAGSQAAGALGKIVDVDFTDDADPFRLPMPSPAKAKEWLQKHPELLKPQDKKDR